MSVHLKYQIILLCYESINLLPIGLTLESLSSLIQCDHVKSDLRVFCPSIQPLLQLANNVLVMFG